MSQAEAEPDPTLPAAWIVMFLLLVLGLGAAAVLFVGGDLIVGGFVQAPFVF
jgi:hypothetical protein